MTVAQMVERVARKFHDTYERLAIDYGYVTRKDTRAFVPGSTNGQLMMAVIRTIFTRDILEAAIKAVEK